MTEDNKKKLRQQLALIADEQRGNMRADDFMDYLLGLIFYSNEIFLISFEDFLYIFLYHLLMTHYNNLDFPL